MTEPRTFGRLESFPRARLGHLPTPLEEMKNLTEALGGARLYVKRDDCTGLAMGGNKVRQLEYYLGEAISRSADTVLITGAVQSNYVRMAAAGARKLGMDIHIQLERRVPLDDPAYRASGNVLLDRLLGATLHSYPIGEDEAGADARLEDIAADLRRQSRRPFVIHLGLGHPPLGALGYVTAAAELVGQLEERKLRLDEIVVASGSGHTHAGLLFGLRALGCPVQVMGACVRRGRDEQMARIEDHCARIAQMLEIDNPVRDDDVRLVDDFLAPGYGQLNPAMIDALKLSARREGLILDPVYTAKAMAAAFHRSKELGRGRSLLFVHTGGVPAIFGYESLLTPLA
jgi:D-cysteine desulfhydrase family pyridoxal phosphate-dependent enzyme